MNKKILIITPKFLPSIWWIEEQVRLLWENFLERWYQVNILTNNYNKLEKQETINWLNVFRYKNIFEFIFYLIKNKKYDLIISRQYYKNSLLLWLLKYLKLIRSITVVCTDSGWENDEINNIKRKLSYLNLYKLYFFIIWQNSYLNCLNQDNISHLKSIYINKQKYISKITNIYNWINIEKYKYNKVTKIQNLLFLWRLEEEKWIFETIQAFKLIDNTNIILNIIWYWEKNIENSIIDLIQHDNRIIFHWKKYWKDKENIIKNTDLFLFPTYYSEWQPVTLTEMVLYNIPIISTNIANTKKIYWNNITYTKEKDIIDLKEKIEFIISNIKSYNYNYVKILKNIDINNITNQFLNLK